MQNLVRVHVLDPRHDLLENLFDFWPREQGARHHSSLQVMAETALHELEK